MLISIILLVVEVLSENVCVCVFVHARLCAQTHVYTHTHICVQAYMHMPTSISFVLLI